MGYFRTRNLHAGFPQQAASSQWRVRIFRKENREVSSRHRDPDTGSIAEELYIFRGIERPLRVAAFVQRHPADLFAAIDRQLNVEITPVDLETRAFAPASLMMIDRHVHAVAVDLVSSRLERRQVAGGQQFEGVREGGVQRDVALRSGERIEDHLN